MCTFELTESILNDTEDTKQKDVVSVIKELTVYVRDSDDRNFQAL